MTKVLIVDDCEMTRRMLTHNLQGWGYETSEACDGVAALAQLRNGDIRLVIADWMMPNMDGLELCRKIRSIQWFVQIYIILLTAKEGKTDLLEALEAGADEYVRKPVECEELRARIRTGERTIELHQTLAEERHKVVRYAAEMETLARERARQLVHAERMATMGMLSAGLAHEINNPATFISGNIQTLEKFWPHVEAALASGSATGEKLEFIRREMPPLIAAVKSGMDRISRIIAGLKTFAHRREGVREPVNCIQCMEEALVLCANTLKKIEVVTAFPVQIPSINADPVQLEQVFLNLLVNAADALEGQTNPRIQVTIKQDGEDVLIRIEDNGPGIDLSLHETVWQPFFTTKPAGKGTGLGLSICRGLVEAHGGAIVLKSRKGEGAAFDIRLPRHGR